MGSNSSGRGSFCWGSSMVPLLAQALVALLLFVLGSAACILCALGVRYGEWLLGLFF